MLKRWVVLMMVGLATGLVHGSDDHTVPVGRFSQMTPGAGLPGWEPMTFSKIASHTRYTLVNDNGRTVLRADSRASASGMVKKMESRSHGFSGAHLGMEDQQYDPKRKCDPKIGG